MGFHALSGFCRIDQEINPLRVALLSHATSLGSDDAPAKVIQLGSQCGCEACPRVVLLLGKLIDFPGDMLRDGERDVSVVAPLPVTWDAIDEEVGDLAAVVTIAHPIKCPSLVRCQGQGIHGCVSRSGVLRIVLRTPVGGVSQPSESSDSVPCHNSTSRIVA